MTVYLDHAATTPLDPSVREAMAPYLNGEFGNASSLHTVGRRAREAVEHAREQVAAALGVEPLEVLFTSGGTESDNLAVRGTGEASSQELSRDRIVTSVIEHHAVHATCEWLWETVGHSVAFVPPGPDGVVDPDRLLDAVPDRTALVSLMAANNEVGTIQPIDVVGPALAERGIPFHTDAVQAFGRMPLDVNGWGITALSLSAHKFNGPQGVGVLMLRRDAIIDPLVRGGGQERGVRSGTLNVAGIVGCGAAAELTVSTMDEEVPRLRALRDRLRDGLLAVDGVTLNGSAERRLPNNVHVAVNGCDGEALLLALDEAGVACSTGSACQSGATEPSRVLEALGVDTRHAQLRFTLGRTTTAEDIGTAITTFTECVDRLRGAGGGFG